MPAMPGHQATAGRPPATSREDLERVAFALFAERGFHRTTVGDIAGAAGIGRRTFFRYFESKNDVVWGDFGRYLDRMRADLAVVDPDVPLGRALTESIVAFNTYPADELAWHRRRMQLILSVPELQAHSTLQYAAWREVVAEYAAARIGVDVAHLRPQVIAHTALGAAVAAYDRWLLSEGSSLVGLLREALEVWAHGVGP